MQWRAASDKLPPNKVDVFIKEYGGPMDIGWYSEEDEKIHTESDLGPLSIHQVYWLDESPPASAVEEAARLYPKEIVVTKEHSEKFTFNQIAEMQRSAHITCAGMYTGEIEKGREAIDILKALCALKKHKDTVGKDEYYEKAQPEVWKIANKFLGRIDKK